MTTDDKYPISFVISLYTLLGGVIGGLVFNVGILSFSIFEQIVHRNFDMSINSIEGSAMGGLLITMVAGIFGMPPAFLTGLTIGLRQYEINSFRSYLKVALLGAIYSALITLLFFPQMDSIKLALMFAVIGGLSAVILAKLVVPKATPK